MDIKLVIYKELVIKTIRDYLYQRGFHEVVVPTLQSSVPLEPNIYPFTTMWNTTRASQKMFLSTSPESALKKYIADGGGDCFAIAPAFRNFEDTSPTRLPEFLMLEWYQLNATHKDIMDETQQFIDHTSKQCIFNKTPVSLGASWPRFTMTELFQKHVGVPLQELINDKNMVTLATQKGYSTIGASWEQLFNQIFLNEVEPKLSLKPCFITDYPSKISPLCKPITDDADFAERFELYINRLEIANGNTENTDAESVRKTFLEEQKQRKTKSLVSPPVDELFLESIKSLKTKRVGGVGLGIDRLVMVLSKARNVHLFSSLYHTR